MTKAKDKLPILDLYLASWLTLNGIPPEFTLQGTRVIFEFPVTSETYRLTKEFNQNPSVPILDFISVVRKLRSQMLIAREGR
jgi:hypothetical protein